MRNSIYILTLLALTVIGCGQKEKYPYKISDFRPEFKKHIQRILAEGQLSYEPDTLTLNFLKDSCSKDELLKLMNFENPLVRVSAYIAIVNRNEPDYFSILLNHLDDTTKVTWWYYDDAADESMVSDLMIRKAVESRKLSQYEKQILVDSILLKHSYLDVSNWMIQEIEPNEKYYSIIKEKSKVKTDRCGEQLGACYALSKFNKKEDLKFLKSVFNNLENPCEDWIFKSIEEKPKEIYFPVLKTYFNETIRKKKQQTYDDLKLYCRAVARYKNQNSLDILVALTKKETYLDSWYLPDNKESVFRAIHKYKSPIYDSLYNAIKPQMDELVMKHLDTPDYDDIKTW
jgi:hypothetical protein